VPVRSARAERTAPVCRRFERGVVNSSSVLYSQEELQIDEYNSANKTEMTLSDAEILSSYPDALIV
jgi:hypothetical protein